MADSFDAILNTKEKRSFHVPGILSDKKDFDGPLDLLLFLISKNDANIYDLPISLITEQFIEYLENNKTEIDKCYAIENIVYNELINRNYEVYIGKTKNGEIDFLAKKDGNIKYIQVTYEMKGNDSTIEREFGAYKSIEDNYPKYVISLDKIDLSRDGIIHLNLIDFLLSEEI